MTIVGPNMAIKSFKSFPLSLGLFGFYAEGYLSSAVTPMRARTIAIVQTSITVLVLLSSS